MMWQLTVMLAMFTGVIALLIASQLFASIVPGIRLNQTDELVEITNRLHSLVFVKNGAARYNYDSQTSTYHLTVSANLDSNENAHVFPVIKFKGKKVKLDGVDVSTNQVNGFSGEETIRSNIPPMRFIDGTQFSGVVSENEEYFIKNFVVRVASIYQLKFKNIPLSLDCKVLVEVKCKSREFQFSLYLPDQKKCDEQQDVTKCRKTINACDGEINVELTEFQSPGEACSQKRPVLSVDIIEQAEQWKTGEKVLVTLWKTTDNPIYADCWQKDLAKMEEACFDTLVGAGEILIPIGPQND